VDSGQCLIIFTSTLSQTPETFSRNYASNPAEEKSCEDWQNRRDLLPCYLRTDPGGFQIGASTCEMAVL